MPEWCQPQLGAATKGVGRDRLGAIRQLCERLVELGRGPNDPSGANVIIKGDNLGAAAGRGRLACVIDGFKLGLEPGRDYVSSRPADRGESVAVTVGSKVITVRGSEDGRSEVVGVRSVSGPSKTLGFSDDGWWCIDECRVGRSGDPRVRQYDTRNAAKKPIGVPTWQDRESGGTYLGELPGFVVRARAGRKTREARVVHRFLLEEVDRRLKSEALFAERFLRAAITVREVPVVVPILSEVARAQVIAAIEGPIADWAAHVKGRRSRSAQSRPGHRVRGRAQMVDRAVRPPEATGREAVEGDETAG